LDNLPLTDFLTQSERDSHTEIENAVAGFFEVMREIYGHEKRDSNG
jgi:hypothetical protein